jgi:hypothetical protein
MITRRTMLLGAGGAAAGLAAAAALPGRGEAEPAFLGACDLDPGKESHGAAALDARGRLLWRAALPARAHEAVFDPAGRICALVDRAPGRAISLCDLGRGATLRRVPAPDDRSFDGHLVFTADGSRFLVTESRVGDQQGSLGLYAVVDGRRQEVALPTHGIEPHQLVWAAGQLVVANGGIVAGAAAREVESGLAVIAPGSGALIHAARLPALPSLSLRHLAATPAGEVLVGMQDQDPGGDLRPVVALLARDGTLSPLPMAEPALVRLRGYVGSVAVDAAGEIGIATAPHGGVAALWHLPERRHLGLVELADTCGVAAMPSPGCFMLTSGGGDRMLVRVDRTSGSLATVSLARPPDHLPRWDNHLAARPTST